MTLGQLCGPQVMILHLVFLGADLECYPENCAVPELLLQAPFPAQHPDLLPLLSLESLPAYRLTTLHFLPAIESHLDLSESLDSLTPVISGMKWG